MAGSRCLESQERTKKKMTSLSLRKEGLSALSSAIGRLSRCELGADWTGVSDQMGGKSEEIHVIERPYYFLRLSYSGSLALELLRRASLSAESTLADCEKRTGLASWSSTSTNFISQQL
jgi:hypothetical protein